MFAEQEVLIRQESASDFTILKSDNLVIGGYASIEIVDKQNDLITLEALEKAVQDFMSEKSYRNVMSNHSNVQVGEVIEQYRDSNGTLHKTGVDGVGFYVVIKMRDDIEKAKEINRGIRKGTLRSFSIGGQAISKRERKSEEYGEYNEIDNLELHEVTICEKGINPEAKFDILKAKGGKKMTEKLEKALEELNGLLTQVREVTGTDSITKEEEDMKMYEKEDETMKEEEEVETMEVESADMMEEKALDEDSIREIGGILSKSKTGITKSQADTLADIREDILMRDRILDPDDNVTQPQFEEYMNRNKIEFSDNRDGGDNYVPPILPIDDKNPEDVDTNAEDHAYDALRYLVMSRPRINDTLSQMRQLQMEKRFNPVDSTFGY